jgi:hypothetical protein
MKKLKVCVRSDNSKKLMILEGDRQSFRCRQRNKVCGQRVESLKFVSFKEMQGELSRGLHKMNGTYEYHTMSKL